MKYAGTHSTIEYGGEGSILVAFTDGTQSSVDVQAGDGFVSRKRTYPTSASTSSLPTSSPNSTLAGTKSKSKKRTGVFDKGPPLSVLTGYVYPFLSSPYFNYVTWQQTQSILLR